MITTLYYMNMGAWGLFTLVFGIYNVLTDLPRSRRHMHVTSTWIVWSILTLGFIIWHFH